MIAAPDLSYSNVSSQPLGLLVRSPALGFWRWASSTWTSPYAAADHVLRCTPDPDVSPDMKAVQAATVPAAALVADACVIDGTVTVKNSVVVSFAPTNTYMPPVSGYSLVPVGRGTLTARLG